MALPDVSYEDYQRWFHRVPFDRWAGPLDQISADVKIDLSGASQSDVGRNVVVITDDAVVKLIPPFWREMWERECVALRLAHGKLSVSTPLLLAAGDIGAWTYVVMERIRGTTAGRGADLDSLETRHDLAFRQGYLAEEIGGLGAPESLRWDWRGVIDEDLESLPGRLEGLPAGLAASALEYVSGAGDLAKGAETFLHGDLSSVNFLRSSNGDLALVDWSDAGLGPRDHEFISPFMHQFRGASSELAEFWEGFGPVEDPAYTTARIMARSIVKYAILLPGYLADLPGRMPKTWTEAAERLCRIPD